MSARAAWRLETLGYSEVYRYTAGKVDWLASGLPTEGEHARESRVGGLARGDLATCHLDQRVGDVDRRDGLCIVVNEEGVVLGDLRGEALEVDPRTPVEEVMNPGPVTYRPDVSVRELAHELIDSGARRVLISDSDGRLIGLVRREDVFEALDEHRHGHDRTAHVHQADGPVLANTP